MSYEVAIVLGLSIMAFALIYLSTNLKRDHWPLQILFMIFSMFILFATTDIMVKIADLNSQTAISDVLVSIQAGVMWVGIVFTIAYFFMMFIFSHMKILGSLGSKKSDEDDED